MASSPAAGDLFARLPVEVENAAGVVVKLAAGVGEFHPPADAAEQGHAEFAFEGLDALADGGLGQAEVTGGGEARPLGGLGEGVQVGGRFGHGWVISSAQVTAS